MTRNDPDDPNWYEREKLRKANEEATRKLAERAAQEAKDDPAKDTKR